MQQVKFTPLSIQFLEESDLQTKDQIRKRRDKWIDDVVISKGISVFNIPTSEGVAKNDTL